MSEYGVIGSGWRELSSFLLTDDGLAVYREAGRYLQAEGEFSESDLGLVDPGIPFPVFDTMCVYRLQPESVRWVSRQLHFARVHELFDVEAPVDPVPMVALTLTEEGIDRTLFLFDDPSGLASRVLQVLTALLPEQRSLIVPVLPDESMERHLLFVPEPHRDLAGALKCHLELLAERQDDRDLMVETCTLAIAHGDRATADSLLARIERIPDLDRGRTTGAHGMRSVAEQLRRLRP